MEPKIEIVVRKADDGTWTGEMCGMVTTGHHGGIWALKDLVDGIKPAGWDYLWQQELDREEAHRTALVEQQVWPEEVSEDDGPCLADAPSTWPQPL